MDLHYPLITFIVPCYNVERLVQQCLDSIFTCGLSVDEFEILCINDFSSDGTLSILELNEGRNANLHIINLDTNKGPGCGRNIGIREAKGNYIWFVDADDEIVGEGLRCALEKAIREKLDILCFNYRRINESGQEISRHLVFDDNTPLDGYSFVGKVFKEGIVYHMGYVVRFLYRTEYLRSHSFYFPENEVWEDTVYMPETLLNATLVSSVPSVLYSYRINTSSICETFAKSYPSKYIYDYSFCAGLNLLRFSEKVKDEGLKKAFFNTATRKYINGFPLLLFRANRAERKGFFTIVAGHKPVVLFARQYMDVLSRLLLLPIVGPLGAALGSTIYKLKHSLLIV